MGLRDPDQPNLSFTPLPTQLENSLSKKFSQAKIKEHSIPN